MQTEYKGCLLKWRPCQRLDSWKHCSACLIEALFFISLCTWGHWLGISECGHFPQCIVRRSAGELMRRWGYMFTLCCLTLFFYLFYWLFFCCWVNLGLCALRCKQKASNRLLLLASIRPVSLYASTFFILLSSSAAVMPIEVLVWADCVCLCACVIVGIAR